MSSFNQCTLVGNLVRDPELTYLPSGTPVAKSTLAVNEERNKEKFTLFIPFTVFGKGGEVLIKYSKKGDLLLLSGRLSQYTTSKGETKHTHTELTVTDFRFMGTKSPSPAYVPEAKTNKATQIASNEEIF